MDAFTIIEDGMVILRNKGVFKQAKVYRRGDRIFAGYGGGFIRLGGNDMTSAPNVKYEALDLPFEPAYGAMKEPLMPKLQLVEKVA